MLEKHTVTAVTLGALLCSIVAAGTYAQDKLERFQEQPRIVDARSLETALKTIPATSVIVGEPARANLASRPGIEVQLLRLLPLGGRAPALRISSSRATARKS